MPILAPPLAPGIKRHGRLVQALSCLALATALLALIAVNLALLAVKYYLVIPEATPRQFYHRAWQMARENLHDRYKLKNWDRWEHKFDSRIRTQADALRFSRTMIASLKDRYTFMLDAKAVQAAEDRASAHFIGIGISFKAKTVQGTLLPIANSLGYPVIQKVIAGAPAYRQGLKAGDVIVEIDKRSTLHLTLKELIGRLVGKQGAVVALMIERGSRRTTVSIARGPVSIAICSTRHLGHGIGYIRLSAFDLWNTAAQFQSGLEELNDCRAIIVDVRDNPGGFVWSALETASMFLDHGTLGTLHARIPNAGYLSIAIRLRHSLSLLQITGGTGIFNGLPIPWLRRPNLARGRPVVVLVNGNTASAAEVFTAALADNHRVVVLGTSTFGKGIGQTYVPVANRCRLRITNFRMYTPSGRWLGDGRQAIINPIRPDVVIQPDSRLEIGGKHDNQLQKAESLLSP